MRKSVQKFFIFLNLVVWLVFPSYVLAQDDRCSTPTSDPEQLVIPENSPFYPNQFSLHIGVADRNLSYQVDMNNFCAIGGNSVCNTVHPGVGEWAQPDENGSVNITLKQDGGGPGAPFQEGDHPITLIARVNGEAQSYCTKTYHILKLQQGQQVTCNVNKPKEANTDTNVTLTGSVEPSGGPFQFVVTGNGVNKSFPFTGGDSISVGLGSYLSGTYQVKVQQGFPVAGNTEYKDTNCSPGSFTVQSSDALPEPDTTPVSLLSGAPTGPTSGQTGATQRTVLTANCTDADIAAGKCTTSIGKDCPNGEQGVMTALGCIPTQPGTLIQSLIRFATGIGGGIALLLMIIGGFRMVLSQGDPEGIKRGQQQFTAAFIGLLFIIFAVIILRFIGVDLLGLPGFGR